MKHIYICTFQKNQTQFPRLPTRRFMFLYFTHILARSSDSNAFIPWLIANTNLIMRSVDVRIIQNHFRSF